MSKKNTLSRIGEPKKIENLNQVMGGMILPQSFRDFDLNFLLRGVLGKGGAWGGCPQHLRKNRSIVFSFLSRLTRVKGAKKVECYENKIKFITYSC